MAPKFGTSGLRGLVVDLTAELVRDYVQAFIAACPTGGRVYVGWDLRPSSPEIARAVMVAIRGAGLGAVACGAVPTPALALASMQAGAAAIMVTGSHIPADRNGLKFYLPTGEISKADEAAIVAALGAGPGRLSGALETDDQALARYGARYRNAFGPTALGGQRIGVYQHSSVARDVMADVLQGLGAETVALARSDVFIPVDTEAVDPGTRTQLAAWAKAHGLDAIVSTDGDADRPMVADATGRIVPGDVLGPLAARALGARHIVTPVSSNSLVDQMGFDSVVRTKIGSPFVIAAMDAALANDATTPIVGYEANGGFLLGFAAAAPAGSLGPLMTRDSLLPIVAPLVAACSLGQGLAQMVADLPPRFTAADRLQGIASNRSAAFLAELSGDRAARAAFFEALPPEQALDQTDGLRVTFAGGAVVHLRPSGNAPEFRCYAEAETAEAAWELVTLHLDRLNQRLT